jgi:uncharacterized protein HemX
MADEVYTRETVPGDTTVIRETRSGGGAGWAIAIVLILALIAGVWFFSQNNRSEVAKDNAVTAAANNVGDAARDVGNAAQDAANNAGSNSNH